LPQGGTSVDARRRALQAWELLWVFQEERPDISFAELLLSYLRLFLLRKIIVFKNTF
jgi:hypothetical protein